ncbi:MAG: peptidylprolyl isomerase [Acidimicrobiia bacterium]
MGTAKRERQKANRQLRLQQIEKQEHKEKTKKRALRIGLGAVGFLVLVVVAVFVFGGSGDDPEPVVSESTTTIPGATTTALAPVSTVPGAAITGDTPCPAADGSSARTITFAKAPPTCIDPAKTYTALVETPKGNFTIALDAKKAPVAVNNFVVLARYHYFDGVLCHRIIPNFVVQCGDPQGDGKGGPGYTFADELPAAGEYKLGSLAMANSGKDTNGSQFFIITGSNGTALPPQYTLFGQVTDGFDTTVKALEATGSESGATTELVWMQKVTITES